MLATILFLHKMFNSHAEQYTVSSPILNF